MLRKLLLGRRSQIVLALALSLFATECSRAVTPGAPVRVVIVGLVHDHARGLFGPLSQNSNVQLVGISEPDTKLAANYANHYHLDQKLFFTDTDKMLDQLHPDAVLVYTDIQDHRKVIEAAALIDNSPGQLAGDPRSLLPLLDGLDRQRKDEASGIVASHGTVKLDYERELRQAEFDSKKIQLEEHLDKALIRQANLKGITGDRILSLESFGIETAKDVPLLHNQKVPGIGPVLSNRLFDWRDGLMSSFRPQQASKPSFVMPHVCCVPALSEAKRSVVVTAVGASRNVVVLSPSCPEVFSPQQ